MTTARDAILAKLRSQARGDQERPAIWQLGRQFDDLAGQFATALTSVAGEVIRADSLDDALDKLDNLLADLDAQQIVANDESPLRDLDVSGRWPEKKWHIVGKSEGDLRAFCASADVGLSGAEAALAETGSLIVTSGPGKSRLVTLLPPVHVALVATSSLIADIFTWMADRNQTGSTNAMPANRTIITGPSKSGDIEQVLALGMHGPKRFIVILYEG